MKILLLGEFSSLHKYLKEGIKELGEYQIDIAADSQGWKEIGGIDIPFTKWSSRNFFDRVNKYYGDYRLVDKFRNYDVVQMINTCPFTPIVNKAIFKKIRKNNGKVSLVSAGVDYALVNAYLNGFFEYYIFDLYKKGIENYDNSLTGRMRRANDKYVVENSDVIIPSLYEYSVGYHGNEKLNQVIPFPINLKNIEYKENRIKEKIVFFHGINNELTKGTPYIREALERLKNTYPNDVEIIIDGHMPFEKYVKVMERANVVIDQCLSYGYGINTCIAMAQGKVVMAGLRTETLNSFGIKESPIISITPDVDDIYNKLCWIIEEKKNIPQWGYESRMYVENIHDYVKVARQYVDAWNI